MSLKKTAKVAVTTLAATALVSTITGFAIANSNTSAAASTTTTTSTTTTAATSTTGTAATGSAEASTLPRGYQIVALPNKNVPNFQRRIAWCPSPKRVIGGGGEAQGNNAVLVGSFPTQDGRGWIALGRQTKGRTVGISVYAICAL
jgi:hypothetical protein